ncbi:hypothetical protein AXG93_1112s1240 [Marchantia polymorpha subsp. ruderalis]|uniref:Globin domain-containing protein n=1 Tax=Marchantia polymorpha subsp. ruderalis TaxID=1480154 RepID=A0A176WAI3_MARPO|nr:hypothetical protein AXG93_1112s1240 [Marchantia polymorpha subsp. ruderalis]
MIRGIGLPMGIYVEIFFWKRIWHLRSMDFGSRKTDAHCGTELIPDQVDTAFMSRGSKMAASTFTKEQSQLVIESWQMVKKDSATHSVTFFAKIFEIAPGAKALFSFLKDSDIPFDKNPKLKAHALTVFRLTGDSACMLGEKGAIDALHPKLKELGKKHVGYGVIAAHFDLTELTHSAYILWAVTARNSSGAAPAYRSTFNVVKAALLSTIESLLPEDWPAEKKVATCGAWSQAYDELAGVMINEMQAIRDAEKAPAAEEAPEAPAAESKALP